MPRPNFSRMAMKVHRWSGLLGALVFVVVGLSGAVLVFHEDLDAALFPELFDVSPGAGEPSFQRAVETAQRAFPDARLRGVVVPPPDEARTLKVQFIPRTGGPTLIALVDPFTGELRGTRIWGRETRFLEDPVSWIYQLHYQLTAGRIGQVVTVVASMLLMLSVLTGAFVYRKQLPRALTLRTPFRAKGTAVLFSSLHRLVGTWVIVLNLVLAVSGLWILRGTFTKAFWTGPEGRPVPSAVAPSSPRSFDEALEVARRTVPGFAPSWIDLRAGATEGSSRFVVLGKHRESASIYGRHASTIVIDGRTLEALDVTHPSEMSLGGKLNALAFPIHQGHWGGLLVRLIWVFAGLGLPLLSVTGTMMWWLRTRRAPHPAPAAAPARGPSRPIGAPSSSNAG